MGKNKLGFDTLVVPFSLPVFYTLGIIVQNV